jgi:hypothetical protein
MILWVVIPIKLKQPNKNALITLFMKKLTFLLIVLIGSTGLYSQVSKIKTDAEKVYDNGTRTSYVTFSESVSRHKANLISVKLEAYPEIHRFSFYNTNDLTKCMFTADVSTTDEKILEYINYELSIISFIKEKSEEEKKMQQEAEASAATKEKQAIENSIAKEEVEKAEWIKNNPEKYEDLKKNSLSDERKKNERLNEDKKWNNAPPNTDTDNIEYDRIFYQWAKEHPDYPVLHGNDRKSKLKYEEEIKAFREKYYKK